jgi:hypothetical protein
MRCAIAIFVCAGALAAQTMLSGTVHAIPDAPAAGVLVTATSDGGGDPVTIASDEHGSFTFRALKPGAYRLTTDRDLIIRRVHLDDGQNAAVDIEVPADPVISGRLFDSAGKPVPYAEVRLLIPEYNRGAYRIAFERENTDADGVYAFYKVDRNRHYYVMASPPGAQPAPDVAVQNRQPIAVRTYYPSARSFDGASPILLQPGEQIARADIVLASAPYYCADGNIAGAAFIIEDRTFPPIGRLPARGQSDESGRFRACGLAPGSYRLTMSDGSQDFIVKDGDVHDLRVTMGPAHLQIEVAWDREPALDLSPAAQAALRAVTANLGESDPGAVLRKIGPGMMDDDRRMVKAITAASHDVGTDGAIALLDEAKAAGFNVGINLTSATIGMGAALTTHMPTAPTFETTLAPGEYHLDAWVSGKGQTYVRDISYQGAVLDDPVVQLAPGANSTLRIVLSSVTGTMSATVDAVSNATIVIVPESATTVAQFAYRSIHVAAGTNALPPGKYRVFAISQPVRWEVPEDLEKLLLASFQGAQITLDDKTPVQISLTPVSIY